MKTKIIISGAAGRMGRQLIAAVNDTSNAVLAGATEKTGHPAIGTDAGVHAGIGHLNCEISADLAAVDMQDCVLIDFSEPEASLNNLRIASPKAKMVIGTTGFSETELDNIRSYAEKTAIVMAPNMSIGMNLLFKLTRDVARVLGDDYNIEIVEAHHKFKKDAPSGSAKRLAEMAAEGLGLDLQEAGTYGRHGIVGERKKGEIGVHAVRAGDIVGDHTVLFGGQGERIELRHQAHSRETFARGAVRAALWLSGKETGLFDMQDVLGLK